MASSMLTGDRRWGQPRKSGMTVLGKVPKPINLPSQKSENHGLDPNVEIVPKGTLTWGSRPSSSTTNAWGTSLTSSPHADGSASPSFASGRPSSGGSGTRPSTAGSDRSFEPVSSAWGTNSRPSSASGILASSQMSAAATRPRSADTRPGSSQLSRFAESTVDNTGSRGTTGTADRLGVASSNSSGFTLSSGDFPTLGSDKNSDSHSQRGHSSQGRPTSASGSASALPKETLDPRLAGTSDVDHLDHGNVNTWKAENHHYGDGTSPYTGNWQQGPHQPQPYVNMNMPPHHIDSWHNPQFHPADGNWYRGGPPVGPYRPPGPHGSYSGYPHASARPPHNSQVFPRPEPNPPGYRPNIGEQYPPHMPPEPYMRPGHSNISLRPGPYPGRPPYEGYYGPHTGFCNSSEKGPLMPMVRPVIYNHPNFDPGQYNLRPGGYAPPMYNEQAKSDQAQKTQGQFRVLLKQHDGWEGREEHGRGEQSIMGAAPHLERRDQHGLLRQEEDLIMKNQKLKTAEVFSSSKGETAGLDDHSSDTGGRNVTESSTKVTGEGLIRREETTNERVRDRKHYTVIENNAPVIEKGVSNRARVADGQNDMGRHSPKQRSKSNKVTIDSDLSTSIGDAATSSEAILVSTEPSSFMEKGCETSDDKLPQPPLDQKTSHGVKGVQNATSKSSRHRKDELSKKPLGTESIISTHATGEGGQVAGDFDYAADLNDQRAKMKEIAMQRAEQLKKEEEERTREQKAKALAKLEELDRRKLAESSNRKISHSPPPANDNSKKQVSGAGVVPNSEVTCIGAPTVTDLADQRSDSTIRSLDFSQNQSLKSSQESVSGKVTRETASVVQDTSSKHKQSGNQRRKSSVQVGNMGEKETSTKNTVSPKEPKDTSNVAISSDAPANNESSVPHRKKNNNNNKSVGNNKSNISGSVAEAVSLESPNKAVVPTEATSVQSSSGTQALTESTEDSHVRKAHTYKKSAKHQHTNKQSSKYHSGTESVIWAPVKPVNKSEPSAEVSKNGAIGSTSTGQDTQGAIKTKRAEIERYVPKPVSKELTQQQHLPSQTQSGSVDITGKADSATSPVECGRLEIMVGQVLVSSEVPSAVNIKHNQHTSASWHQFGTTECPPAKNIQQASAHTYDGWNDVTENSAPIPKNVGTNRQRRQQYKPQRTPGNTYSIDNRDTNEVQSSALGPNNAAGWKNMNVNNENAIGEHPKSLWQPKPQANNHRGKQGNRGRGGGLRVSSQAPDYNNNESKGSTVVELAPVDVHPQHQQDHQGHYNNHFRRGHSSGTGKTTGRDVEERKNSVHMEYQQVENYHKPADSASSGSRGSRFRGGGHFRGRGRGGARVSDSYIGGD